MNSSFSMFSGESRDVKLRFDNKLINTVIDRFGKDVSLIPDGNEHFTVHVKVKAEAPFFAWLFQFGSKAKIDLSIDSTKRRLDIVLSSHSIKFRRVT